MQNFYRERIAKEFRNCVQFPLERMKHEYTYRPFHAALLSEEILRWSSFERSFSTSFGQRAIEEIARIAALSNGATQAVRQKVTMVQLDEAYVAATNAHIRALRDGDRRDRDWESTMRSILRAEPTGRKMPLRVISDLWWEKDGVEHFVSLKTVKPNIDQTAVAKQDCIHLTLAKPGCKAYFGLPYNPYGEDREDYAFSPPMGIFDIKHDPVVLIGKELWDTIGGEGCYETVLEIAREVGRETREKIAKLMG